MEGKKRKVSDANFDPDGTESFRDDERRPVFSSAKALEERETRSGPGLPITLDDRKQVAGLFEDDDDEGSDGKREEERLAGAFMLESVGPRIEIEVGVLRQSAAFMTVATAISNDALSSTDNETIHAAVEDVLASDDGAAAEALSYLFRGGASTWSLPGHTPFAVIAARRLNDNFVVAFHLLVELACASSDFSEAAAVIDGGVLAMIWKAAKERAGPV